MKSEINSPDYMNRASRIFAGKAMREAGIEAVVLLDARDIFYLTGMREGIQSLIITCDEIVVITHRMFEDEAIETCPHCRVIVTSKDPKERPNIYQFTINFLSKEMLRKTAVDAARMTHQAFDEMQYHARQTDTVIHPIPEITNAVRAIKDDFEIALTRRCIEVAESAFRRLLDQGAGFMIGKTEKEIAWTMEAYMREAGADRQGFPGTGLIVASGPNSAGVHPKPGNRVIREGEVVLIDWGAEIDEYRSDSTRTVFPGTLPGWAEKAYPVVLEAHMASVECLRDGGAIQDADLAARNFIKEAGYEEFHYGVGHGVGLQIHESPWIRATSTGKFETGMVTTIEPGIYLPGTGGIRIEDMYHIQKNGSEIMGCLTRSLEDMVVS